MNIDRSRRLFAEARTLIPGGVNSPVRAFKAVGGEPRFIARGEGAYLYDVDGNRFIDYVLSWGPLILGHAHPAVAREIPCAAALRDQLRRAQPLEVDLAGLVRSPVPNLEMIRFVNSGTEAIMSLCVSPALSPGRGKIVKFEGCYHGHADLLLVNAGSGVATLGLPDSPGVPPKATADTLTCSFNDIEALKEISSGTGRDRGDHRRACRREHGRRAPEARLSGRSSLLWTPRSPPRLRRGDDGFSRASRRRADALRRQARSQLARQGHRRRSPRRSLWRQGRHHEHGRALGAGLSGGDPLGNPLAMTAGIVTLRELRRPGAWSRLEDSCARLETGLKRAANKRGVPTTWNRVGTMFTTFFTDGPVIDWTSAKASDTRNSPLSSPPCSRTGSTCPLPVRGRLHVPRPWRGGNRRDDSRRRKGLRLNRGTQVHIGNGPQFPLTPARERLS